MSFRHRNVCHRLNLRTAERPSPGPEPLRRQPQNASVPESSAVRAPEPVGDLDRLERRLAKVTSLLQLREDELRQVYTAAEEDTGLPALHPQVTDLAGDTPLTDHKRQVMSRIFEANLELQRRPSIDR